MDKIEPKAGSGYCERYILKKDKRTWSAVYYLRSDLTAFYRTYRQICNSLTIE
jgi:hypothetical protein